MIASLKGVVEDVTAESAVLAVGGVGYLVQASRRTLAGLVPGQPAYLRVETQVRDNAITLFAFRDTAERDWFRLLTGVQGVGGRVALAILGALTPDALGEAVALEDKDALKQAPGVGARLATRVVTELRGKPLPGGVATAIPLPDAPDAAPGPAAGAVGQEARSALLNLGFREGEAQRAVAEAQRALRADGVEAPDLDVLIRAALKRAARS